MSKTEELEARVKQLEAGLKARVTYLEELLWASLPSLRCSYKACHDLSPYEGTDAKYITDDDADEISNYAVYREVKEVALAHLMKERYGE